MTHRAETLVTKRAETLVYVAGECRICGCTEVKPCRFLDPDYPEALDPEDILEDQAPELTCYWVDACRTLCSNPRCLAVIPLETIEREIGFLAKAAGR
jgi:hypothetical protein